MPAFGLRPRHAEWALAGDDKVDRFRSLALLVRLDVEGNTLPLVQSLQPCPLDGRDVNEHVASTIVRFDEAVSTLCIEELNGTCHGHRETPFPRWLPPPAPTARR